MDFDIAHLVQGVNRDEFERLFFDEQLNDELCKRLSLDRRVIELKQQKANLEREVEITMGRQVPPWVRKLVGDDRLVYRETMLYRFGQATGAARWRITPQVFAKQIDCSGTVDFEPHPQGVVRHVRGQVTIKVPMVGSTLERFAVHEIEKSFTEAAEWTNEWVRLNGARPAAKRGSR